MKNPVFLFLIFIIIVFQSFLEAQTVQFIPHKVKPKLSFEVLQMDNEQDLGMLGIGADFHLFEKVPDLYITLNSYSAVTGNRPGLISIGTGLGYTQQLFDSNFYLDTGAFVGGGGGASAPDGGGLITREHLNLLYQYKNLGVFAGYSRMDFPTGNMGSNNFNFGITLSSPFEVAHRVDKSDSVSNQGFLKSRSRVNLHGKQYIHFTDGPSQKNIRLVGIEIDKFIGERFYGALKLSGAISGGVDGYMNLLVGLGFQQNLWSNNFAVDARILG